MKSTHLFLGLLVSVTSVPSYAFDGLADGERFSLKGADRVEKYEVDCHFTLSNELTQAELDQYKAQKCYGLRFKDAIVVDQNGNEKIIPTLDTAPLQQKVVSFKESSACTDLYVESLNTLFDYKKDSQKEIDLSKQKKIQYSRKRMVNIQIPSEFEAVVEGGRIMARSGQSSSELKSDNGILNKLAQATNAVANRVSKTTGARKSFDLYQLDGGEEVRCNSIAMDNRVEINNEKYNAELSDGSVWDDMRKAGKNIFGKTRNSVARTINNITTSSKE